jgi:hypothetical protein
MRPYHGSENQIEPSSATTTSFGLFSSLPLEVAREHLAPTALAVRINPDDRARRVLADDQPPVRVQRHPVALVARAGDDLHAVRLVPAPARVARHVGEEEIVAVRVPDRPLGEDKARPELLDLDVLVDQFPQRVSVRLHAHPHSFLTAAGSRTNLTELRPRLADARRCDEAPACRPAGPRRGDTSTAPRGAFLSSKR